MVRHIYCHIVCFARHTITGLICTSGRQFFDWCSEYRLYSKGKSKPEAIYDTVLTDVAANQEEKDPVVSALDDTILRKSGKKTPGVSYRRDPMSPPFHCNLIRGQRVIQVSAAYEGGDGSARMLPVEWCHAPTAPKPRRTATEEEKKAYQEEKKRLNLSKQGVEQLQHLRARLDTLGYAGKELWNCVDGSYTNRNVLKDLPERTVHIGRIRSDAKLYYLPSDTRSQHQTAGRPRDYGSQAPTPEEVRKDQSIPWQKIPAYVAGKKHKIKVKTLGPLKWRAAGKEREVVLIVIAPLGYRLRKNSKILYRQPAYLICTKPELQPKKIVQAYFWRWGIEMNFRDEKTLLGLGEAQVRNKESVEAVPRTAVAAYSALQLAGIKAFGYHGTSDAIPAPKWRNKKDRKSMTTSELINILRMELWAGTMIGWNFSGFANSKDTGAKPEKLSLPIESSIFFAIN